MQNYSNHAKSYKAHFFIFAPIVLILFIISIYRWIVSVNAGTNEYWIWMVIAITLLLLLWFSSMTRVHYSLTLQDRIIVLEENFRYYRLTGKTFQEAGLNLRDSQIIALRFASDKEFLTLVQKTVKENLSNDEIKKNINSWRADHNRV